jgi:hypothetical protein
VESCFDLVPLPPAEVDEAEVARALSAPAEPVGVTPIAGVEPEVTVALPEPSPSPSPGSIVEAGDGLGAGWIRRSLSLPIPLADRLDQLSAADQRHAVELLLAVFPDITHADRVHAVLAAHGEVVQIARDMRELRKMFGPSLPPRLTLRLRHAAHMWADKLLRGLGEESPAVELPVPGLGTEIAPEGVPGHWEPVVIWMPFRHHHHVPDLQVTLTESMRDSDEKWESIVGNFFVNERKTVEAHK